MTTDTPLFSHSLTGTIARFLNGIGIPVSAATLDADTFLPGVAVQSGGLVVDEAKLDNPGDLLHEAGHLAVVPAALRRAMTGEVIIPDAQPSVLEVEAMCWSYAAAIHLKLDPRVVFHENGYHGRSESILFNFSMGIFIGVSGLESYGMTYTRTAALAAQEKPFPVMRKWLRD